MAKKRVYEVARERGLESAQVLRRLKAEGVDVKAAASTVDDDVVERIFGTREPSVSPSSEGELPTWLSASGGVQPKTRSKEDLEKKAAERQQKADAAKAQKSKAQEQAKRIKQKMLEKKRAEADAAKRAKELAEAAHDEPVAAAPAEVVAEPEAETTPTAPAEETPVEAEAEAEAEAVTIDEPADTADEPAAEAAEAVEVADEPEAPAAPADEPEAPRGPEVIKAADAPEATEEPAAEAAPDPAAPPVDDASAKRRLAQQRAQQRASELAARRRAQMQAEKLEADTRARLKKKDRDEKAEAEDAEKQGPAPSRVARVSRDSTRRTAGGKRRVIIDAGAGRRKGGGRGKGKAAKRARKADQDEVDNSAPVDVPAGATVKEVAEKLDIAATEIIRILMQMGDMATITQSLSDEQMELVAEELERVINIQSAADEEIIPEFDDAEDTLETRAPVVTIMGHVDHGKTSLLDALRETDVAEGEAGGITQHIGAYQVEVEGERKVTFLDTPGHEAFTALRARGAKVTDVAVLVVAADDGVKPQTIEAIDHARAAEVPIVVAINKIDKENAQPDRVKGELAEHDLQPEDWGGSTVMVNVSAKQKDNLDELIELLLLQADLLELKANPSAEASGYVIESELDAGRGPTATMLISRGTLRVGDVVVAGDAWGKVRAMVDHHGVAVNEATPAMPVEVLGFDSVPTAGEFGMVVDSERVARDAARKRARRLRAEQLARRSRGLTLDDFYSRIQDGAIQDLNVIIKADVAGSVDALEQELSKVEHDEVRVKIIHSGVGGITGSDVMLAAASNGIILGFNVRPNVEARESARQEGVDVRTYNVIYKLREDVEQALSGMLSPEEVEKTLGEAEVRQTFKASKIGTIAGCYVTNGTIERSAKVRLVRDGTVVHEGTLSSLKRFKDDVRDVAQGYECGLAIEGYNDVKEGDVVEAYTIEQVERDLSKEFAGDAS